MLAPAGRLWNHSGMPTAFFLNGPNADLPGLEDAEDAAAIGERCALAAARAGLALEFRQTQDEGRLIDWIQEARGAADGLLLQAAALSCTSVAVLDALLLFDGPVIELRPGRLHRRGALCGGSLIGRAATATICGLGAHGCELAIGAMARLIAEGRAAGFRPARG
jgi:3-dehydroquinate dehydratase-2